jgi:glycosyltransferase involved in cell wall biosynthesis
MRLLVLNWRDARHPRAGGAEFHTHELARRFVQAGHQVEWFTATFPGAATEEFVDGIHVVRKGRQWTVHLNAYRHYGGSLRGRFDAVIDEINTIPFFTPMWAGIPVFAMIWQLAREVWWYESRFPLNAFGYAMEPLYLKTYRKTAVFTFSESTASDLRNLGFTGKITLVPVGIEPIDPPDQPKGQEPTFIYVGRLAPSKRVHEILIAFATFQRLSKTGRLVLIGDGPQGYVRRLTKLAERLGVSQLVTFSGWLRGAHKHQRMAAARALLMASAREGWGLVVTECNACGTPAIVYDVPGLRDSVRHLATGLVVPPNPDALANAMLQLAHDEKLYQRLQAGAQSWSRTLTYEAGSRLILDTIITGVPAASTPA